MRWLVEYGYLHFPPGAAKFYDHFMLGDATRQQVRDFAEDLSASLSGGRLLDVGMGPGRLLEQLHELNEELELFGCDIAETMVEQARRNLDHFEPDLRCQSILETDYEDDFFDVVTCTGSFYVWQEPVACLNEIHRILAPGGRAILYETFRDFPRLAAARQVAGIVKRQGGLRGLLTPLLLGQQLRMTYRFNEIEAIVARSKLSDVELRTMVVARLPIWVRIEGRKVD